MQATQERAPACLATARTNTLPTVEAIIRSAAAAGQFLPPLGPASRFRVGTSDRGYSTRRMAATLFTTTELLSISGIRLVARRSESRAQQRRLRSPLPRGAVTESCVAAFSLAGGSIRRRAESAPPPAPQRRHSGGGSLELSGPHKNAQPGQPRRRLHRIRVFPPLAVASAAALKARASQPATAPLWLLLCTFRPTQEHPTQAVARVSLSAGQHLAAPGEPGPESVRRSDTNTSQHTQSGGSLLAVSEKTALWHQGGLLAQVPSRCTAPLYPCRSLHSRPLRHRRRMERLG